MNRPFRVDGRCHIY